jgi:hypothetical protein
MSELRAARRLVKSAPELWETCSDPMSLRRHLGAFGEIRITRLEPESTVAWEGESASGTVELEPSGWGTKVTLRARAVTGLTAEMPAQAAPPPPVADDGLAAPPPTANPPAVGVRRRRGGLLGWLLARLAGSPSWAPAPVGPAATPQTPPPPPEEAWPEPPEAVPDTLAALEAALDSLGAAHHRPFSRG